MSVCSLVVQGASLSSERLQINAPVCAGSACRVRSTPLGMLTQGLKRLKNARAPFRVFALLKYLSNTSSPMPWHTHLSTCSRPLLSMHMTRLYERGVDLEHRAAGCCCWAADPMKRTAEGSGCDNLQEHTTEQAGPCTSGCRHTASNRSKRFSHELSHRKADYLTCKKLRARGENRI